jgi:DNA-binding MarR family transcriptional regulator
VSDTDICMMQVMLEDLDAALGRLRRLYDQPVVRAWFQQRLDLDDVDAVMYRTLRAVDQVAGTDPSINGVAAVLRIDASTASRFVERAVAAGLVTKATDPDDRRRTALKLAPRGRSRLTQLRQLRVDLLGELTHDWSAKDIGDLIALLDRFDAATERLANTQRA